LVKKKVHIELEKKVIFIEGKPGHNSKVGTYHIVMIVSSSKLLLIKFK